MKYSINIPKANSIVNEMRRNLDQLPLTKTNNDRAMIFMAISFLADMLGECVSEIKDEKDEL